LAQRRITRTAPSDWMTSTTTHWIVEVTFRLAGLVPSLQFVSRIMIRHCETTNGGGVAQSLRSYRRVTISPTDLSARIFPLFKRIPCVCLAVVLALRADADDVS
jgi:hypothetical protein